MRLAEVIEQIPAQAAGGLAVAGHLLEADEVLRLHGLPLLVGQLVVFRLVEDQVFGRRDVAGRKEQDAVGGSAVASGAAGLLIICLHALGHVAVDDVGNVRLVDAHAEGVRGDHDGAAVADEILLILPPLVRAESGVVARGGETAALQQLADLLDALARGTVDDAALVPAFFEQLEQRPALVLRPQDLKAQVRPVKAGDDRHRVLQLQDADDVAAHLRRRRGGEGGQGGPPRQLLQKVQNFQIARAEILPPLGDAVRLVDREQRDLQLLRERAEAVGQQPLRRDVEDLVSAEARVAVGLAQLLDGHGAVDAAGRDAGVLQGHDLILHERDERRDDERQPRQQQGWQLIAKALAAARRHDAEHIAPGQDRVDKRLLPLPEGRKPKILSGQWRGLHRAAAGAPR